MVFKIRKHKNPKRGTELTYATIPLEEARNLDEGELRKDLMSYYPDADAKILTRGIKEFASSKMDSDERIVLYDKEGRKGRKGGLKETGDYLTLRKTGKKLTLLPTPLLHQITKGGGFGAVSSILENGFKGRAGDGNAIIKRGKDQRFTHFGRPSKEKGITQGDSYCLELYPDEGKPWGDRREYVLEKADPKRILSINIELDPSASEQEREEKMEFYKKQITHKHGVPVRYFLFHSSPESQGKLFEDPERIFPKNKSLEKRITGLIAIISLGFSSFFIGSNITGNVIGLTQTTVNWIGAVLLGIGLIAGFFWLKKRK
ncbi:hypothetical protein HOC29_00005 [archaeon]|jgi:hypothetical protein|nr:hypothetical protein [archaeon]